MHPKDVMKEQWLKDVVPEQVSGQSSFTYSRIKCRNNSHVTACFDIAAQRLWNVNQWHEYAGKSTATFQLFDEAGNSVHRPAKKGDYLRINIPGPDNPDTEGGDWVQVVQTGKRSADEKELTFMTVTTAANPMVSTMGPTHFFDQPATSTFVIYRKQLTIMAAVFGRNEHSNLSSPNLITKLRNWLIYIGAQLGLANLQWKALTHGLLNMKEP